MKKRILTIFSLILILGSLLSMTVFALDIEPEIPEDPVDPDEPYVDISYYNCGCSLDSGSGLVYCSSYAQTRDTTYKIYLNITLQRYKDGYWQTYAGPWSGSGTGYAGVYKYYYVVPGYYYRTASAVTVRDSSENLIETSYLYSPSRYYGS